MSTFDLSVSDYFFNFESGSWRYANQGWIKTVFHDAASRLIKLIALIILGVYFLSYFFDSLKFLRQSMLYALLVMGVSIGLVALGKQTTGFDCPRALERYGGAQPYIKLFDRPFLEIQASRGKCFPGGHSSGAFSLFFLYFWLRDTERFRKFAILGIMMPLSLGGIYALIQWARGAHFPSHDWWSLFICWFVASGLYRLWFSRKLHVI